MPIPGDARFFCVQTMSRIQTVFERLQANGRRALIPFITAGDPDPDTTVSMMRALVRAGADILELGVPFSDPVADGPTIQRASERALAKGMTLRKVLSLVKAFRATDGDTPVVLMGYANPIEAMGTEGFVAAARDAGVDGVLVVDYPPEECRDFAQALKQADIDPIFLLAPTSTAQRIEDVAQIGSGYIYYVSLKGVTGAGTLDFAEVAARIPAISERARLPVAVGFGIRDADAARRIGEMADAVVIGSRIIEEIENSPAERAEENVVALVGGIRQALDQIEGVVR